MWTRRIIRVATRNKDSEAAARRDSGQG
jgi:hypothetical protein